MGNTCEECDDSNKKDFRPIDNNNDAFKSGGGFQILPIKEESMLEIQKDQNIKDILLKKVRQTLDKLLQERPLAVNFDLKGERRPLQFIAEKNLKYQGQWLHGQPHGKGSVQFDGRSYLEAYFNKGQASCKDAILIFPDGSFYRGELQNSLFHGKGKLNFQNNTVYDGDWAYGVPHGKGQEIFANKNTYKGDFQQGFKQGKGVFTWSDGKIYEGEFKKGKMHGKGKLTKGEQSFQGEFVENKKTGKGELRTKYGLYKCEFDKQGQISGKGTFEWNNHTIYRGSFDQGLPHGEGTIQFPNKIVTGVFQKGVNTKIVKIDQVKSRGSKTDRSQGL